MCRRFRIAALLFLVSASIVAGCSGRSAPALLPSAVQNAGAYAATQTVGSVKTGQTPPPSLVKVTPAPGYPAAPPLHVALVPATPYPAPSGTPHVIALPTAIGGGQVGGTSVASSVATALASVLPTPEPDTIVYGTIQGYSGAAVIVETSPFLAEDKKSASPAGVGKVSLPKIPARITFAIDGKTVDAVPGGYRSLRTGDRIMVVADLKSRGNTKALYLTDLDVLGKNVKRATGATDAWNRGGGAPTRATAADDYRGRVDAVESRQPLTTSDVRFRLTGKTDPYAKGVVSQVLPALPYPIVLPFGTIDVQYEVSASYGESSDYPLKLVDETPKYPWQLNVDSKLPIAVLNDTASSPTFTADGTGVIVLSVKVHYTSGNGAPADGEFMLEQSSDGNDGDPAISFQSTSDSKLLVPRATATMNPSRKGEYTFDLPASLEPLVETLEPSTGGLSNYPKHIPIELEEYIDGTLTGGPMAASFKVTNADPADLGDGIFNVDDVPIDASVTTKPVASPNVVTLHDAESKAGSQSIGDYLGTMSLNYESTVTSPFGKIGPTKVDTFKALPNGQDGFAVAKYSPPPSLKLVPSVGNIAICAKDTNAGNSDGGGSCGYSNGSSGVVLDIVRSSPATIQVSDTTTGGLVKPVKFSVNANDPPPQSLSGVPPVVCSTTNITIQPPLTGKTDPWTVRVSVPAESQAPQGGCGFSIADNHGTKVYVSLTDDVP